MLQPSEYGTTQLDRLIGKKQFGCVIWLSFSNRAKVALLQKKILHALVGAQLLGDAVIAINRVLFIVL